MKPWQIITLGIILLGGYAVFAVGGYFVGSNVIEQKWQAKVAYIAYAEERVCHARSRIASDISAIVTAGQPTDDVCASFRESEGSLGTQATTWKSVTPPEEWQGWHADISAAMDTMCQSYEHLLIACDYHANRDIVNASAEMSLALGVMQPAIESLKPKHRPWAFY